MKKALYIIGVILLILIITNPSVKAFKEYLGKDSYAGLKRNVNLFVLSVYQNRSNKYLGFVGNFWEIPKEPYKMTTADSLKVIDSAKMADSSLMALPIQPKMSLKEEWDKYVAKDSTKK